MGPVAGFLGDAREGVRAAGHVREHEQDEPCEPGVPRSTTRREGRQLAAGSSVTGSSCRAARASCQLEKPLIATPISFAAMITHSTAMIAVLLRAIQSLRLPSVVAARSPIAK